MKKSRKDLEGQCQDSYERRKNDSNDDQYEFKNQNMMQYQQRREHAYGEDIMSHVPKISRSQLRLSRLKQNIPNEPIIEQITPQFHLNMIDLKPDQSQEKDIDLSQMEDKISLKEQIGLNSDYQPNKDQQLYENPKLPLLAQKNEITKNTTNVEKHPMDINKNANMSYYNAYQILLPKVEENEFYYKDNQQQILINNQSIMCHCSLVHQSLQKRISNIEQLIYDKGQRHLKMKRKIRRKASQIQRITSCPMQQCQKKYGSIGSLVNHIRLKHPNFLQQYLSKFQNDKDSQYRFRRKRSYIFRQQLSSIVKTNQQQSSQKIDEYPDPVIFKKEQEQIFYSNEQQNQMQEEQNLKQQIKKQPQFEG